MSSIHVTQTYTKLAVQYTDAEMIMTTRTCFNILSAVNRVLQTQINIYIKYICPFETTVYYAVISRRVRVDNRLQQFNWWYQQNNKFIAAAISDIELTIERFVHTTILSV